ncbi:signal transduction histidine kinase [Cryobacterium sp. MP_3.1]|uniref:ATP-binding protein n=1 Tax=Cryobacterium sp. MP_3.1 TaxID=3071711 RepID=UPI002DFC9DA8|nr:signal transduction histidine kinase [Cryobacterium sp. MP_3.1]
MTALTGSTGSPGTLQATDPTVPIPMVAERPAHTATANLTQLLCIAVAAAAGIFGLLSLPSYLAQAWPNSALAAAAWAASFGLPIALGLSARWGSARILRGIVTAEALSFVGILGFWLIVRGTPLPAGADIPWVITFTGVPCVAVAVFAQPRLVWAFTVLTSTLSGFVRFTTSAEANPALIGLADGLYSLLLVSVFVAFTLAARRASARVDEATLLTRQAEAHRAARVARRQERLSIDALVHDSVISTLLMAGLGRTPPSVVSGHASKTLTQLDALRAPPPQPVLLVSDAAARIGTLTQQIAPDAVVRVDNPARAGQEAGIERTVPSAAVTAILGAVGEALRNSVNSAAGHDPARTVHRRVTMLSTTDGFQVTVNDDGVGFDPALVPPERLGIAESILGRMTRLPDGAAHVRSTPGRGTDVVVAWAPDREPANRTPNRPTPPPSVEPVETPSVEPHPSVEPVETPTFLSRSLDLTTPMARLILALFVFVHGLLAVINIVPGRPLALMLGAYVAIVLSAITLMRPMNRPFPRTQVAVALTLSGVGAILMFGYLPAHDEAPFAHWHLGAITLILVVLAARGQIRSAWMGYAVLALLTVGWAVETGQSAMVGVDLVSRHAGTLLAGSLFVVGLGRSERDLRVLTQDDLARARQDATTVAAIRERKAQLRRVNALARPTLLRLAEPHALAADERAQCLLVEASLRDAIRGRCLFVPPVIHAVQAARQRGVEVTVLDDSADTPPEQLETLARTVADVLDTIEHGRVTVRVLPAGRADVATLVIESGTHRILGVGPDGALRSP